MGSISSLTKKNTILAGWWWNTSNVMLQTPTRNSMSSPIYNQKNPENSLFFLTSCGSLLERKFHQGSFGHWCVWSAHRCGPHWCDSWILWSSNNVATYGAGHPPHPTIHPQEIRPYHNLMSGKGKTLQGVGWLYSHNGNWLKKRKRAKPPSGWRASVPQNAGMLQWE